MQNLIQLDTLFTGKVDIILENEVATEIEDTFFINAVVYATSNKKRIIGKREKHYYAFIIPFKKSITHDGTLKMERLENLTIKEVYHFHEKRVKANKELENNKAIQEAKKTFDLYNNIQDYFKPQLQYGKVSFGK